MIVVAHRGGSKRDENTLAAIVKTIGTGVGVIEYDVRKTSDNRLVLHHDSTLQRVCGLPHTIANIPEAIFSSYSTKSGVPLSTLSQVISDLPKEVTQIIELKDSKIGKLLTDQIPPTNRRNITVTTFIWDNLIQLQSSGFTLLAATKWHPLKALSQPADGITIRWWMLNPFVRRKAKKMNKIVMVYTLNNKFIADLLNRVLPNVWICTDEPAKLQQKSS